MTIYIDNFNRADTASGSGLGSVPSGPAYLHFGTWRILSNRAFTDTADSFGPFAYFRSGVGNVDLSISCSAGGGDAIYFRIASTEQSSNYLRARVRNYTQTFTFFFTEYEWASVNTVTSYAWKQEYASTAGHTHIVIGYSSSPTTPPFFSTTLTHDTNAVGTHSHTKTGSPFRFPTGDTTTSSVTGYYWTTSTTTTDPDDFRTGNTRTSSSTSTSTAYQLILERRAAGTLTTLATADISAPSSLRVRALGSAVSVFYNGSATSTINYTDSTTFTNTGHGFGRASSDNSGTLIDNLSYNDLNSAPSSPTLTAPVGGETLDALHTMTWTAATDPDGDTLKYNLESSSNSGATWFRFRSGYSGTSIVLDWSNAANGSTYRVRVQAVDPAGLVSGWSTSGDFTIQHNKAPFAPLLITPANNSYADLAAGFTFNWQFRDSNTADTQTHYAFRRKISGAASYEYWNATLASWQSTEVWNANTATSVTFAAAKWTNGNTYNWSVATRDNTALNGPYATDATVVANVGPQVQVNAVASTTSTFPTISWVYSDNEGDPQTTYHVKIFDLATFNDGSFNPATSSPVWTSGQVTSTATSVSTTASLDQGVQYRAYVQVTGGGQSSTWAFKAFTITLDPPARPLLLLFDDGARARTRLIVQGKDNLLTTSAALGSIPNTANTTITGPNTDNFYTFTTVAADTVTFPCTHPTYPGGWLWAITFDNPATAKSISVSVSGSPAEPYTVPADTRSVLFGAASLEAVSSGNGTLDLTLPANTTLLLRKVLLRRNVDGDTSWSRGGLVGLTKARVEWSEDQNTWQTVLNGLLPLSPISQTETFYDYSASPGILRYYRASIEAEVT